MKKESKMGKERFSRFCDIVNEDVMREEVESSKLFIKALWAICQFLVCCCA